MRPVSKRQIFPSCLSPMPMSRAPRAQISRKTCPMMCNRQMFPTNVAVIFDSLIFTFLPSMIHRRTFVVGLESRESLRIDASSSRRRHFRRTQAVMCLFRLRVAQLSDHASSIDRLLLLDAEVTLMPLRTRCTSVQIPNATRARTTNRTMMMMAMVSFFFTMVAVVEGSCR